MASDGQQTKRLEPDEAFEKIFDRYYRPVSYYFARRGFSRDECSDLAQETFLRAYGRWAHYRRDRDRERGWIFTIAANLYRNTIRDRRAQKRFAQNRSLSELQEQGVELIDEEDDPVVLAISSQQLRLVMQALDELPPGMRRCFLLRYRQGRKYKEIADALQISIQSVRSQLHRAKKRLQEMLGDD